jgi:hypothetical protein
MILPVYSTSAALNEAGGIKKSALLTALPRTVATLIGPELVNPGTAVFRVVTLADATGAYVELNLRMLLAGTVSKLVPVTVTGVPALPMFGVKPVIVGAPVEELTVNAALLVAEPFGVVTPIGPVVAPAGTVVTI